MSQGRQQRSKFPKGTTDNLFVKMWHGWRHILTSRFAAERASFQPRLSLGGRTGGHGPRNYVGDCSLILWVLGEKFKGFDTGSVSMAELETETGISRHALLRLRGKLVDAGIVRIIGGGEKASGNTPCVYQLLPPPPARTGVVLRKHQGSVCQTPEQCSGNTTPINIERAQRPIKTAKEEIKDININARADAGGLNRSGKQNSESSSQPSEFAQIKAALESSGVAPSVRGRLAFDMAEAGLTAADWRRAIANGAAAAESGELRRADKNDSPHEVKDAIIAYAVCTIRTAIGEGQSSVRLNDGAAEFYREKKTELAATNGHE